MVEDARVGVAPRDVEGVALGSANVAGARREEEDRKISPDIRDA